MLWATSPVAAWILATCLLCLVSLICLRWLTRTSVAPSQQQPAWIHHAVWQHLAQQQPLSIKQRRCHFVVQPTVLTALAQDRQRILPAATALPGTSRVPPLAQQCNATAHAELLQLRGPPTLYNAIWPVCCQRLAILCNHQGIGVPFATLEAHLGCLDAAYLHAELSTWGGPSARLQHILQTGWKDILAAVRQGTHKLEGLNIFSCSVCQRGYVASCSPDPTSRQEAGS